MRLRRQRLWSLSDSTRRAEYDNPYCRERVEPCDWGTSLGLPAPGRSTDVDP